MNVGVEVKVDAPMVRERVNWKFVKRAAVRDEGWRKLGRAPREQQQVAVTSLEITWAYRSASPLLYQ
jgi:hypothetical protein